MVCVNGSDVSMYFEDLDEARLEARSRLGDNIVLARVIDASSHRVVDFFQVLLVVDFFSSLN